MLFALTSPALAVDICTTNADCVPFIDACTLQATCVFQNPGDVIGMCEVVSACDDGNSCTADTCIQALGTCTHTDLDYPLACDDGNACTLGSVCTQGACVVDPAAGLLGCDDGDPCTVDLCDPAGPSTCAATGSCCLHLPVVPCFESPACEAACDDGDACTQDGCDPNSPDKAATCQYQVAPAGSACSLPGSDPCSVQQCNSAGQCVDFGGSIPCDDNNPCTEDSCTYGVGCQFVPKANGEPCDDGNACTVAESCSAGQCVGTPDHQAVNCCATAADCDGAGLCGAAADCVIPDGQTLGTCVYPILPGSSGECCYMDGNCLAIDICNGCDLTTNQCVSALLCDDQNTCTTDTCTAETGCTWTPNTDPCEDNDGEPCTGLCANGACMPVAVPDGLSCTAGVCWQNQTCTGGVCQGGDFLGPLCACTADSECNDFSDATSDVGCCTGSCVNVFHEPPSGCASASDCDDSNPCTTDTCVCDCPDSNDCPGAPAACDTCSTATVATCAAHAGNANCHHVSSGVSGCPVAAPPNPPTPEPQCAHDWDCHDGAPPFAGVSVVDYQRTGLCTRDLCVNGVCVHEPVCHNDIVVDDSVNPPEGYFATNNAGGNYIIQNDGNDCTDDFICTGADVTSAALATGFLMEWCTQPVSQYPTIHWYEPDRCAVGGVGVCRSDADCDDGKDGTLDTCTPDPSNQCGNTICHWCSNTTCAGTHTDPCCRTDGFCNDGDSTTLDRCIDGGCVHSLQGASCDSTNPCVDASALTSDICAAGTCDFTPMMGTDASGTDWNTCTLYPTGP